MFQHQIDIADNACDLRMVENLCFKGYSGLGGLPTDDDATNFIQREQCQASQTNG